MSPRIRTHLKALRARDGRRKPTWLAANQCRGSPCAQSASPEERDGSTRTAFPQTGQRPGWPSGVREEREFMDPFHQAPGLHGPRIRPIKRKDKPSR